MSTYDSEVSNCVLIQSYVMLKLWVMQWLHRSAFSFGGLGSKDYKSSQDTTNLVFGTSESNTEMIR